MEDFKTKIEASIEDGIKDTLKLIYDTFDTNMVMAGQDPNKIAEAKTDYIESLRKANRIYNEALFTLNKVGGE